MQAMDAVLRRRLAEAVGQPASVTWICQRFRTVVFAVGLKESGQLEAAAACVEPVLRMLCRQLISGNLPPDAWMETMKREVAAWWTARQEFEPIDKSADGDSSASSLQISSIPRVARRRALVRQLSALDNQELIAILLRLYDDAPVDQIAETAGLSVEQLPQLLVRVEGSLRDAMEQAVAN